MAIFNFANQYIPDPTRDAALAGGELYLGFPNTDPELPGNQFPISAMQEDGTTVQIPQPVQINQGGVIVYNGSPVQIIFTQNSYSTKVNKNGSQFYYIARTTVSEGISISEWNTETEYFKDISIVRGSDGKGYYATNDSGPSSASVDPVTDTDNSHWMWVAAITPVGEGDNEIPTNSQVKGRGYNVGDVFYSSLASAPEGSFHIDGSTIVNGVVLYPELAASGSGAIDISGNDIVLKNGADYIRGKGDSARDVGEFQEDALQNITGSIPIKTPDTSLVTGAFEESGSGESWQLGAGSTGSISFDASRIARTATETRVRSLTFLPCVYHGVFS